MTDGEAENLAIGICCHIICCPVENDESLTRGADGNTEGC